MLCEINVRSLAYRYHEKYLLSVTVIQLYQGKKTQQ